MSKLPKLHRSADQCLRCRSRDPSIPTNAIDPNARYVSIKAAATTTTRPDYTPFSHFGSYNTANMAEVRRRGPADKSINSKIREEDNNKPLKNSISFLDILRILGGIALLNTALSYYITGDAIAWGVRPWWVKPGRLQGWLVRDILHFCLPSHLTRSHTSTLPDKLTYSRMVPSNSPTKN